MSEATAAIRQAIHDGANRDEFIRIARAFDRLELEEVAPMIALLAKHLDTWPDHARIATASWWKRIVEGEEVPPFRFARGLELDGVDPELVRALASSPFARQFHRLTIRNVKIGDEGAKLLASSERLMQVEDLALIDTGIGAEGALALLQGKLRPLASLDLSGNELPDDAVERLAALVEVGGGALAAARCGLGPEAARELASSRRSERLIALDLSANDIGDAGIGAIAASGWFAHLASLSIASNGITARGARALAHATWIRDVSALDVSDNPLGDEGFEPLRDRLESITDLRIANIGIEDKTLAELLARVDLRELDASGNRIGPASLARMGSIERLSLRDVDFDSANAGMFGGVTRELLDLAGNRLTMAALAVIGTSRTEHLDLSRTGIGDVGLALIADSPVMESVRTLGLANDGITPDGLEALLSSERTIRLAAIDLSDNPLGPEGARLLAESKLFERLTRIRARNCGFAADWTETLRSKMENCRC